MSEKEDRPGKALFRLDHPARYVGAATLKAAGVTEGDVRRVARQKLLAHVEKAIDQVIDIAENASSDKVRLLASLAILDRAGMMPKSTPDDPNQRLHETDPETIRLATARLRTLHATATVVEPDEPSPAEPVRPAAGDDGGPGAGDPGDDGHGEQR